MGAVVNQCFRSTKVLSTAGDHVNGTLGEVSLGGGRQRAIVPNEMAVEISELQEMLKLRPGRRLRPPHHRFHIILIHLDIPIRDDISQKGDC